MPTVTELLAQKAAIEAQIAEAQRHERAEAIARVRALMADLGVTVADLNSRSTPQKKARAAGKVAPKYRNAATGETWSGRGLHPKWLKAALASGKTLGEFTI